MLRAMNWLYLVAWSGTALAGTLRHDGLAYTLGACLAGVNVAQCVVGHVHLSSALDAYLGRGPVPRGHTRTAAALLLAALGLLAALVATGSSDDGLFVLPLLFAVMPFGCAHALIVPVRTFVRHGAFATAATIGLFAAAGAEVGQLVGVAVVLVLSVPLQLLTVRCSAWNLSVMWESERARETKARLAVAEERLRFGRDLHDVMGRNLSVVALKSELAAQLARRGDVEAAVAQMVEVQRIARESQKDVRDVVRGYREVDLAVELVGAQGVLDAAGIACTVTGDPAGLPGEVQSALAWVVREAATNVLRHGDAAACRVSLERGDEGVVLTVENDGAEGAAGAEGGVGSGLAGLRERLAGVDGSLDAGFAGEGVFRVVAAVPVTVGAPVVGGGGGAGPEDGAGPGPEDGAGPGPGPEDGAGPGDGPGPGSARFAVRNPRSRQGDVQGARR
ncbi:sensor histidine kinase [Streptomyces sp. VRA16 Mangrove soil]|nr:sensor histidine kinase [Streptomyces sp. VRA16 Mangrove soil]